VHIRFHPGAAVDLGSAGDWYEQQLPGLASDLTDEVDRALEAIAERPSTWPVWPGVDPALGVRRFLLPRFPFAIGYVVQGDSITVLAIAHLRRRPGYWLLRTAQQE
jgi:toxin ParE1/3/4